MLPPQPAPTAENIIKLAVYVAVLIMPGGSIIALGMWWLNRRMGKSGRALPFSLTRRAQTSQPAVG
jgi:uncharacterized lipoprotein YmbA